MSDKVKSIVALLDKVGVFGETYNFWVDGRLGRFYVFEHGIEYTDTDEIITEYTVVDGEVKIADSRDGEGYLFYVGEQVLWKFNGLLLRKEVEAREYRDKYGNFYKLKGEGGIVGESALRKTKQA